MELYSDTIIYPDETVHNLSFPEQLTEKDKKTEDTSSDLKITSAADLTDDEKIDRAAVRILEKYLPAFKELAK